LLNLAHARIFSNNDLSLSKNAISEPQIVSVLVLSVSFVAGFQVLGADSVGQSSRVTH